MTDRVETRCRIHDAPAGEHQIVRRARLLRLRGDRSEGEQRDGRQRAGARYLILPSSNS